MGVNIILVELTKREPGFRIRIFEPIKILPSGFHRDSNGRIIRTESGSDWTLALSSMLTKRHNCCNMA